MGRLYCLATGPSGDMMEQRLEKMVVALIDNGAVPSLRSNL